MRFAVMMGKINAIGREGADITWSKMLSRDDEAAEMAGRGAAEKVCRQKSRDAGHRPIETSYLVKAVLSGFDARMEEHKRDQQKNYSDPEEFRQ